MNQKMTLEHLKQAHEVGATHASKFGALFKIVSMHVERFNGSEWVLSSLSVSDILNEEFIFKIDYSPLTDYQQDKALDIAVTGMAE